jgi:hypothetical protein
VTGPRITHAPGSTQSLVAQLRLESYKVLNVQPGKVIASSGGCTYWFDQTSAGWARRVLMDRRSR